MCLLLVEGPSPFSLFWPFPFWPAFAAATETETKTETSTHLFLFMYFIYLIQASASVLCVLSPRCLVCSEFAFGVSFPAPRLLLGHCKKIVFTTNK